MEKYIIILVSIAAWIVEPGQSLHHDINNIQNVTDLSSMEFLSRLIEESKNQENLNNKESYLNGRAHDIVPSFKQYGWRTFHSWFDTKAFMVSLIMKYRNITKIQIAGSSFEDRSIVGIKISHKEGNKGIVIEAGIHGSDWITSASATYLMSQLVDPPNETIRTMAESFDWYIFPSVNPDGYVFSRSHKRFRFWGKNLSKIDGELCKGVDLDRNWGFHWGEDAEDLIPCQKNYAGAHAFSEIETKSFSEYLTSLKNKTHLYFSLHSSGQQILYPRGYTSVPPENANDFKQIVEAGKRGFAFRNKTEYRGGSIYDALYPTYGSSVDWVYGTGLCKLAFRIHIRTSVNLTEELGVEEKEILPICEETMDGIQNMINEASKLGYFS